MLDLDEIAGRHEGGLCGCEKEDSEGRMPACDAAVLVEEVKRMRKGIQWCADQDWSYDNHGPIGVAHYLHELIGDPNDQPERPATAEERVAQDFVDALFDMNLLSDLDDDDRATGVSLGAYIVPKIRAEIEAATEGLRKYGQHLPGCTIFQGGDYACDCGWSDKETT